MARLLPGLDPFVESQEWEDFHHRLCTACSDALAARLQPRYVVRVERRVYVERLPDDAPSPRRPDVSVLLADAGAAAPARGPGQSRSPVECLLSVPEEQREAYLVIRHRESMQVVTVLEVLSPSNKRPGSDGRREYLDKREGVLASRAHLVQLDLLRGGLRLPMQSPLPAGDYYAIVSRGRRRPRAEVYAWSVREPLPSIPVPLAGEDPTRCSSCKRCWRRCTSARATTCRSTIAPPCCRRWRSRTRPG